MFKSIQRREFFLFYDDDDDDDDKIGLYEFYISKTIILFF